MAPFTVDGFAKQAKFLMAATDDVAEKQKILLEYMKKTFDENSLECLQKTLNDAVPPGADLGEMIVFADDELTMLWGAIPPRLQSAIHNHTIFANIAPIIGTERNIIFEEQDDGTLVQIDDTTIQPGQILELSPTAIHCIENTKELPMKSLHCYGGNFKTLDSVRTLWDWKTKEKIPFSLRAVMKQRIFRMVEAENDVALDSLKTSMPKVAPLVDAVRAEAAQ